MFIRNILEEEEKMQRIRYSMIVVLFLLLLSCVSFVSPVSAIHVLAFADEEEKVVEEACFTELPA